MSKTLIFYGGIPTDIDVRKLQEKFGVPAPGEVIPYEAISTCLGTDRHKTRWKSVTTAWRKKLFRENNIILTAIPNEGFKCLDSHGRVDFSARKYKGGLRRIVRASIVAASTDRTELTPEEKKVCDHVQNIGAQLKLAAATAARRLTYDDPVKER